MFNGILSGIISAGNQDGIYSPTPGVDGLEVTPGSQVRPGSAFGTTPDSSLLGAFAATSATGGGGVRHETLHDHTGGVGLAGEMDEEAEEKANLEAGEFKLEGGSGSSTPSDTFHSSPSSPRKEAKGEDLMEHLQTRRKEGHIPQDPRMAAFASLDVPLLPHGTEEVLAGRGASAQERRRISSEARHGIGGGGGAGSLATHLSGEGGSSGPIGSRMGFFAEAPQRFWRTESETPQQRIEKLNQGIAEMIAAIKSGRSSDDLPVSSNIFVLRNLTHTNGSSGSINDDVSVAEHQSIQSFSLLQAIYYQKQGNTVEVQSNITNFLISKLVEAGTNECDDPTFGKAINKIASKIETKDLQTFKTIAERLVEEPTWLEWIRQQIKQLLNVISKCWGGDLFAGSIAECDVRKELPKLVKSSGKVKFTEENAWSKFCEEKVNRSTEVTSRA